MGIDGIDDLDRRRVGEVVAVHGLGRGRVTTTVAGADSRLGARSIGAAVLAVRHTEARVRLAVLDGVDGLDGARNVRKVDERSTLFLQKVDQFNVTEFLKVAAELLLGKVFKVFNVADIDVASRTRVHSDREGRRERPRLALAG